MVTQGLHSFRNTNHCNWIPITYSVTLEGQLYMANEYKFHFLLNRVSSPHFSSECELSIRASV
jgi:hypothetical protein